MSKHLVESRKKQVGKPFSTGNPGRPLGSRNKATLAVEALLDGEAEALTRKAVELALQGDTVALRLCLERIAPARKDRPVAFSLPRLERAEDAVAAAADLLAAVASGELTPAEAAQLSKLVDVFARAYELRELEERVRRLEEPRDVVFS